MAQTVLSRQWPWGDSAMDKLTYLAKTLSRTNRKDYENFVINAIWNRLGRDDIQPVSQQYVRNHADARRFIDLYFPQLNIGIECDEGHHQRQAKADGEREAELIDVLSAIEAGDYTPYHVRVCRESGDPDYDLALQDIERAVAALKDKASELEGQGRLRAWNPELTPKELLRGKKEIAVADGISFRTITDASNLLFDTDYSFQQRAFFVPRGAFSKQYSGKLMAWFPKISVDGSSTRGWMNQLKEDGSELYERNIDGRDLPESEPVRRVVIPLVRDPVLRASGYRFIGVFEMSGKDSFIKRGEEMCRVWRRVSDAFPILGDTPMELRKLKDETPR